MNDLASKFYGRGEVETRRHVKGNKVMIGKFYADGTMIAAFISDNTRLDSIVTLKEYVGADEISAARRLLDEPVDLCADFSYLFA